MKFLRALKTILLAIFILALSCGWGFFAHKKVNRLAVFTLPVEMVSFYKKNIRFIEEAAVNPDRRRYISPDEAPKHYIDLDEYGDSAAFKLPRYWNQAIEKFSEDSLKAHGILPWNVNRVYNQLKDAFFIKDPERILRLSADLGHYVADAHVPLHTTKNYDGQLSNQVGIHSFWESRLPELFSSEYDFFTGKAKYIDNVQHEAWKIISRSNQALDSVLRFEKELYAIQGESKYNFETQGKQTVKVVSAHYSKEYHEKLAGMVERQMRSAVLAIGSLWYTAWVDAGQPDLKSLIDYKPSDEELKIRVQELKKWKDEKFIQKSDTLHKE